MNELTGRLKSLKERFDPIVWLGSVIAAVISGLLFTWTVYIHPAIDQYVQSSTSKIVSELEQIKHKIVDEFDSTYYFSKTYSVGNPELNQGPLTQFFYVGDNDVVRLFIWSSGKATMEVISINGGKPLSLKDLGESSWTNVNITRFVKESSPLTIDQYQGINRNIYMISLTPIPIKNQLKRQEVGRTRQVALEAPTRPEKLDGDVEVYGLLVVRRSPFK